MTENRNEKLLNGALRYIAAHTPGEEAYRFLHGQIGISNEELIQYGLDTFMLFSICASYWTLSAFLFFMRQPPDKRRVCLDVRLLLTKTQKEIEAIPIPANGLRGILPNLNLN